MIGRECRRQFAAVLLGEQLQRVAVATVDPRGRDVVVVITVDPARTPLPEIMRRARIAAGHGPRIAELHLDELTWSVHVPGASKGGAA